MRCQDVERLILESGEKDLSREERLSLKLHLDQCPSCASFGGLWEDMKINFERSPGPKLPADLEQKVRLTCQAELKARLQGRTRHEASSAPCTRVPWPIWAAFVVLTALTLCFLIPGIEEFIKNQEITAETVWGLVLILQNALVLFFIPVIMRRRRLYFRALK